MTRTSRFHPLVVACTLLLAAIASSPASAGAWQIVPQESVFAVVTHKAGIGAKLAHNHFINAGKFEAQLSFETPAPQASRFSFEAAVQDLEVDLAAQQQRWYPRLEALGILDEAFGELADKDRQKIRESMLSKKQLNADKFASLSAEIVSIKEATSADVRADESWTQLPWLVDLKITIAGKTVTKTVYASFEPHEDQIHFEAVGALTFSEFGIKPYSAMLGAIRNDDAFHLFVSFLARPLGD